MNHRHFFADITDDKSVDDAIRQCADNMPPWECIVYNVKQIHQGDIKSVVLDTVLCDFNANVLGAVRVTRSALENWVRTGYVSIALAGDGYKDAPDSGKLIVINI